MGILYSGFRTTLSKILNNKQTFALSVATITISIFSNRLSGSLNGPAGIKN